VTRFLLAWGPALLWVLVLFFLSELREIPDGLQAFTVIPPLLAHVIVYAILGVALGWGRWLSGGRDGARRSPSHALLLGLGYLYGALDEWHQGFVPGRTPSVVDWMADVVGVTLGYAAALSLMGWAGDRDRPKREPPLRRHS
jgi:VanZ family protein